MAEDREALAQLARLLGDDSLRDGDLEAARAAVDSGLDRLTDALVAEASVSDDVSSRASALSYLEARVEFLDRFISSPTRSRLLQSLRAKIDQW